MTGYHGYQGYQTPCYTWI